MANLKQSTQIWLGWVTTFCSLISFILMSYVVPEFEALFEGFGSELPAFTQFIITVHEYFFVLAIPGVIGTILIHNGKYRPAWILVLFSGAMAVLLMPLTIIAMYLPVFQMGSVVSG